MNLSEERRHSPKPVSDQPDKGRGSLSRDEILRVAAGIFREKGYRATSLQHVADHFGVRRPAIYYWFAKKADILVEIQERFFDPLTAQLEEIMTLDLPADEKLMRIITGRAEIFASSTAELAVFVENESELPDEAKQQTRRAKRRYQKSIEELYRAGVREGKFIDIDPYIATGLILSITNGMYRWFRPGETGTASQVAEIITRFACHGLLVEKLASAARPEPEHA